MPRSRSVLRTIPVQRTSITPIYQSVSQPRLVAETFSIKKILSWSISGTAVLPDLFPYLFDSFERHSVVSTIFPRSIYDWFEVVIHIVVNKFMDLFEFRAVHQTCQFDCLIVVEEPVLFVGFFQRMQFFRHCI